MPTAVGVEPPAEVARNSDRDCGQGTLREVANAFAAPFRQAHTGVLLVLIFILTVLNGAVLAELAVFMVRTLHLPPSLVAPVGAAGAIGGIDSGLAIGRVAPRLGGRRVAWTGLALMAC